MKKNTMRKLAVLLLAVMLLGMLSGCAQLGVRKTIANFEKGCKELDSELLMSCLNPKIMEPLGGLLGLLGVDNLDNMLGVLVDVLDFIDFKDQTLEEILKTLKISCKSIEFNDDNTECTVAAEVSYKVGEETVEKAVFIDCALEDETWYIMKFGS
ncbi:MAG: hypothetical protein IIY16_00325 [Oscillospiraceae bacterium]|nr:hypothetical protein [Oscillospiraceae bacterium]